MIVETPRDDGWKKRWRQGERVSIRLCVIDAGHFTRVASPAQPPTWTKQTTTIMSSSHGEAVPNGTSGVSRNHEEYQYLDLVREILDDGEHRPDR